MGRPAILKVEVLGDASKAQAALNRTGDAANKAGKRMSAAGSVMAGAMAAGAVVAGVRASVGAASDLQQAMGGVQAVFGEAAKTVLAYGDASAETVGLSKAQYASLAATIGSQMKNAGMSVDKAAKSSQSLITRGADLAAVFGGTTADAVASLSSALKGEMDPIEKYGVTLNAAAIKAQMAKDGTDKLTGAAQEQAKKAAILKLIYQQTSQAQGAFAKESGTLAGQTERMTAKFENTKAALGAALLPVLTTVAEKLSQVATFVQQNTGWLLPLVAGLLALAAVVKIVTLATAIWNAVAAANPIVLIIVAIVALVAIIYVLWNRSETFRNVVIAVWAAIKNAIVTAALAIWGFLKAVWAAIYGVVSAYIRLVWSVVSTVWRAIVTVITTYINVVKAVVTAVFGAIAAVVKAVWSGISTAINAAWTFIKTVVTTYITAVKTVVTTVFNGIKSFITGVWNGIKTATKTIWESIKNVIETPVNAIRDLIKGAMDLVQGFIDKVTNFKIPSWLKKIPGVSAILGNTRALAPPAPPPAAATTAAPRALSATTATTARAGALIVQVFIGDRELTDLVDTRVQVGAVRLARRITSATGVLR